VGSAPVSPIQRVVWAKERNNGQPKVWEKIIKLMLAGISEDFTLLL
jgi:hypothetical protein